VASGEITSGNLRLTPPHCLLKQIADSGQTGRLKIIREKDSKHIYFENSSITTVESSIEDEKLFEMMYLGGVLTVSQISEIQHILKTGSWSDSGVLDIVDQTKQKWWLRAQIREVIISSFEWIEGTYTFDKSILPPKHLPVVKMDAVALLNTLLSRIQDLDTLVNLMGGYSQVLLADMSNTAVFSKYFKPQDGFFLSRIDGILSVKDLLSMAGNNKTDMARSFVKLHLHGLVHGKFQPEPQLEMETQTTDEQDDDPIDSSETKSEIEKNKHVSESEKFLLTDEIKLTDDELRDLKMLAKSNLDGDFLDLAKALHLDSEKRVDDVNYDDSISYQRGEKFVDEQSGGFNIDGLSKISSHDEDLDAEDDRISYLIHGKIVDGESDLFGSTLSKDIFTEEDEEKQWNMWLISEQEMMRDFEKDWTSTWSDWVENTAELNALQSELEDIEKTLKHSDNSEKKADIMLELRRKSSEFQDLICRKKREMYGIHRRMQLMTYYELLRVDCDADTETITRAFNDWETHLLPSEEFVREFSSMAPQIAEIVNLMTDAYKVLSDAEKREKYDKLLKEKERASEEMKQKKKRLAEDHMFSARTATRRGDVMLALRFIRGSISLDPNNPDYYVEMAKVLAENEKWQKEALMFYHRAYHLNPDDQNILVDVAELANHLNLNGFAIRSLNQVLAREPDNLKAKRLKRKIELTR
jgi:tetratricopeptide (TPR) repeat protein